MTRVEVRLCPRVDNPCTTPPVLARGQKSAFCPGCQKHVHNLSALSASEHRSLISRGGDLCVRYSRILPIATVLLLNAAVASEAPAEESEETEAIEVLGGGTILEPMFLESEVEVEGEPK